MVFDSTISPFSVVTNFSISILLIIIIIINGMHRRNNWFLLLWVLLLLVLLLLVYLNGVSQNCNLQIVHRLTGATNQIVFKSKQKKKKTESEKEKLQKICMNQTLHTEYILSHILSIQFMKINTVPKPKNANIFQ